MNSSWSWFLKSSQDHGEGDWFGKCGRSTWSPRSLEPLLRGVKEGFDEKATSGLFWVPKSKPTVYLVNV